jgi:hypothetical protein
MSKGGAGKVYFVLYLAVVLELLIIIVERDEAEEHLHQKQKAAEAIVRSILSQLQSGAGTEGINTRPQDEITLEPQGVNAKEVLGFELKTSRKYTVEVGVTDISSEIKKRDGEEEKEYLERIEKLALLANVSDIEYQVFYAAGGNADQNAPDFPTEAELKGKTFALGQSVESSNWSFKGSISLKLDNKATFESIRADISGDKLKNAFMHPKYLPSTNIGNVAGEFRPGKFMGANEEVFYYSDTLSLKSSGVTEKNTSSKGVSKRVFVVNFEPKGQGGWYKLRFSSKTNRVLGIKKTEDGQKEAEISDDAKVNIGTVAVKVGDLRKVQKALKNELEAYGVPEWENITRGETGVDDFDKGLEAAKQKAIDEAKEDVNKTVSNINLYNYIAKLLAPGLSSNFDQNKGAIEFNIKVNKPEVKTSQPVIIAEDEVYRFDGVEPAFYFTISPYQGEGQNSISGNVFEDQACTKLAGKMIFKPLNATPPASGGSREYIGTMDKELKGGNGGAASVYYAKLNHQISSKSGEKIIKLNIFPANFDSGTNDLNKKIGFSSYYNYNLNFVYTPSSGNKIKQDQFKTKFKRDIDPSEKILTGYSVKAADNFTLSPQTKNASLKIVWQDPITQREVELYSKNDIKPELDKPRLGKSNLQASASPTKKDIFVNVKGLEVKSDNSEKDGLKITYKVKIIKSETDMGGLNGIPSDLSVDGNNIGEFSFGISGTFKKRQFYEGSVKLTLSITIIGSNGATSSSTQTVDVPISVQM